MSSIVNTHIPNLFIPPPGGRERDIVIVWFVCWVVDQSKKKKFEKIFFSIKNFFFDLPLLSLFPSICLSVCWVVDKVEKKIFFF